MIQSVIPTFAATLAAPCETLLQVGTDPAEGADFGALLAQSASAAKPGELSLDGPVSTPLPITALPLELPVAATTGNILPLALPVIAAGPAATLPVLTTAVDAAVPDQPVAPAVAAIKPGMIPDSAEPAPPRPLAAAARPAEADIRPVAEQHAHPRKTQHGKAAAQLDAAPAAEQSPKVEQIALPEPAAIAAMAATPNAAILAVPSQPAITATPTTPEPDRSAPAALRPDSAKPLPEPKPANPPPEPAPQAFAHAAPHAALLRSVAAPVSPPDQLAQAQTQSPAPRTPAFLRVEIALPVPAALAAKPAEKIITPLRRRADAAAELLPSAMPSALPAPVQPTTTAAPLLSASPRPLDFAALVDRLVAAREAIQPPGALLTVAHAEFGPVELRFRHDERGLAVSLASADPDFARVAAAATPPQVPLSTAQYGTAEPSQPGARGDGQSAAGQSATNGSANGNSRGQASEHRGDAAPQSNPHPRGTSQGTAARRSGIFA